MYHAETTRVHCPYCGELIQLIVDCSQPEQHYIEDCEVCCRPIEIRASCSDSGVEEISVGTDYE